MPQEEALEEVDPTPPEKGERGRSTIVFPYLPLDDAVQVAKGIHASGGSQCRIDQLAAYLRLPTDASMFNLRLNTARIFGLAARSQGIVALTPLGTRICDPQQEVAARAESFLSVPLYAKIYAQFKGASLPPISGLETAIGNMGVAVKQKSNARQVFQRAATQAGFFSYGPDRLVYPPIKGSAGAPPPAVDPGLENSEGDKELDRSDRKKGNGGGNDGGQYHPFITGLLTTLPTAGEDWPMDARRKWLQAASTIFEVIYKDSESKGSLRIEVQKDSGR